MMMNFSRLGIAVLIVATMALIGVVGAIPSTSTLYYGPYNNSFSDFSGRGLSVTTNGSVYINTTSAKFYNSSFYNGQTDYLLLPNHTIRDNETQVTLFGYIYPTNVSLLPDGSQRTIFYQDTTAGEGYTAFQANVTPDRTIRALYRLSPSQPSAYVYYSTETVTLNSWNLVIISINTTAGVVGFNVNGVVSSTSSTPTGNFSTLGSLSRIGASQVGTSFIGCFEGGIDDLVLSNSSVNISITPTREFIDNPHVFYSANRSAIPTGQSVAFTDATNDTATSRYWQLGDGNTSTSQNPVHKYVAAGTYTVNLTATNTFGTTSNQSLNISVSSTQGPVVQISAEPTSGNATLHVNITDTSFTSVTSWNLSYGNETSAWINTTSIFTPFVCIYKTAGSYTATSAPLS